jgi:DNA-binding SARP family transcriptional activator/tetratricopeptide (TPR) repeat protein
MSSRRERLTIRAIGGCSIAIGKTTVNPDSAVLFALGLYMAVRAGRPTTRAELREVFWPDTPEAAGRHSLRQMLYKLKRAGLAFDGDGDVVMLEPGDVTGDLVDLLADAWPESATDANVPALAQILPGYEPAISPRVQEWVDELRATCAGQVRRATTRLLDIGEREGRWNDVERLARRCLEADPFNQHATMAAATAAAMSGAKAEALRVLDGYLWEMGEQDRATTQPVRLLRRRLADQSAHRLPRSGEPPLFARASDIAWLNDRVEGARNGAAAAVLAGPPGIGKSALMRAFAAHAELRGWRFVEARLQASDFDRPLATFVELVPSLLRLTGALGAAPESLAQMRRLTEHHVVDDILAHKSLEAEGVRARVRASVLDLLSAVAHEGPLIVVLEDLHWMDRHSIELLSWLFEFGLKVPVFWLMTARVEGRYADLCAALPVELVPTRTLSPLDRHDAERLFEACLGPVARGPAGERPALAYEVTGGNPLFIREVAGHWRDTSGAEALPGTLRDVMRGRAARLSPEAQRVLHCCAMLGRFADVPRVATVLDVGTGELLASIEEADTLGLIGVGDEPGSLAVHDLWQEELLGAMRSAARALLHLRCGELLERESGTTHSASMASDAARHLIAAGARERAVHLLEESAAYQVANGLGEEAVASLDQALEVVTTDADKARVESARIRALLTIGAWKKIRASIGRAMAADAQATLSSMEHSELELVDVEATMLADMDLWGTIQRSAACVDDRTASVLHRATAARIGARAASNLALAERLMFFADRAERITATDDAVRSQVLGVQTIAQTQIGNLATGLAAAEEALAIERRLNTMRGTARALRYITVPLRISGRLDDAIDSAVESYEVAARNRIAEDAVLGADMAASAHFDIGNLDAALKWLDRANPWAKRVEADYVRHTLTATRAMIALEHGDLDAVRALVDLGASAAGKSPIIIHRLYDLSLAVRYALAKGDYETLQACIAPLMAAVWHVRAFRRQDYFVTTAVFAVAALESRDAATAWLARYADAHRDEGTHPWRELVAAGYLQKP